MSQLGLFESQPAADFSALLDFFEEAELPRWPAGHRFYQQDCNEAICQSRKAGKKAALIVLATGLGKTTIIAADVFDFPGTILVMAHRRELVFQLRDRIEMLTGERVGIEMGPERSDPSDRIVVASVQSMNPMRLERLGKHRFELIWVDECHHYTANTYRRPIEYFAWTYLSGCTATPKRGDGKALGQIFDCCAFEMHIGAGFEAGYLVRPLGRSVRVRNLDISKVKATAGDLQEGQLDEAMLRAVKGVCEGILEVAPDRKGIVFLPGVKSASAACQVMNELKPFSSTFLHGGTPEEEREQIIRDFKRGHYQWLFNCDITTEGFDDPGVSMVALARPTKSESKIIQMAGRGLRPLPGVVDQATGRDQAAERHAAIEASDKRDCLLLDFVGNMGRHRLASVFDALGGSYSEKERALAKKKAKTKSGVDIMALLEEARRELQAKVKKIEKQHVEVTNFDPFSGLDIDPEELESVARRYGRTPVTPKQRKFLKWQGFTDKDIDQMGSVAASRAIDSCKRRMESGLTSMRDIKELQKWGITDLQVTKERYEAGRQYLKAKGFGKKGHVDPNVLLQIIRHTEKKA